MTNFRSRTRARNPCGQAFAELDDSADVLPNQSAPRRTAPDHPGRPSPPHPADQGECDSDGPSRTDPNDLHPAENRKVGGSMPSLPIAPPQLDVAGPRSALGPCRSGRARASAGTNGRQGFRGPAGRRASISAAGMMQVGDSDCGPKVGVGVPSVTPAPFPQLKGHTAPDGAWQPDHAWLQFCERFPITNLRQIA